MGDVRPRKSTRTLKCEYCGTSEPDLVRLLEHYYAHFLIQDYRDLYFTLDNSPEKILHNEPFKGLS